MAAVGGSGFGPRSGHLAERSKAAAFGASTTAQQRENLRLDRERDRLEKERLEREGQEQINQLSEEQKEEVIEAVS